LDVSDNRLPALTDMDMLDADVLVSPVSEPTKSLDLHAIGPQQSSRRRRELNEATLGAASTAEADQN
jgi:hypothetical protein